MRQTPPSPAILSAFGATAPPTMLPGGMGGTWRSGQLVLKRSAEEPAWHEWEAQVLAAARTDGVRVQHLRAARDGRHVVDGWIARDYLVGAHAPGRWPEIVDAADALHAALAVIPDPLLRPPTASREHAWAVADRIAWGEIVVPAGPGFADQGLTELLDARRPVSAPSQLVHGDLTGNVLFADGLAPGIIDFSPYLRPTAYAVAVVVADAVVWEGADLDLLATVSDRPEMGQCLVRALIFRHVTSLILPGRLPTRAAAGRYARLRNAALTLAAIQRR